MPSTRPEGSSRSSPKEVPDASPSKLQEKIFFNVVRAGFAHKRKVLRGNLAKVIPAQTLEKLWIKKNWPTNARAENFTLEQWKDIAKETSLFHTGQAK
jgi:16S rRNA A1518/A1519 N6-dimethyltransferase RsmA/KsgA/DIM1 with predicted DNA glycosylase/AP lyase activity